MLAPREVLSVSVPVGFDTAWAHLRRPELIRRWYGWDRPSLDEDIRRRFLDDAVAQRSEGLPIGWLRWHNHDRLEVRGTARRSTITLRRPGHVLLASYDGVRDEVDECWITWLEQLRFALAEHNGEDRHSFAVRGLTGERPDRVLYRVGLHGARGVPVGGAVEIRRPDGTLLGGSLEYAGAHQFGVRLLGHGGSLLTVQLVPAESHPPTGAVHATWNLWGLRPEELEDVRERWATWWRLPALPRGA